MRAFRVLVITAMALFGGALSAQANGHFYGGQSYYQGYYGTQQPVIISPYTSYPYGQRYYQQQRLPWPWNQVFTGAFNPYSTSRATCANVRCASGSQCIDSIYGPRCQAIYQPRPQPQPYTTCAQVLCSVGNRCEQRGYQAVCVPNGAPTPAPTPSPSPNDPDAPVCPAIYQPVCAVPETFNCVTTPCEPPKRTFGNACSARAQGHRVISNLACP